MRLEEFTHLIEVHGTNSNNWPSAIREDLELFLVDNESAAKVLADYHQLEQELEEIPIPNFPNLEQRVLNQSLPPKQVSIVDNFLSWLFPTENLGAQLWRPAMAACLPLIFGIVLGNYYSFGITPTSEEFESWDDELAMLAFTDYGETVPE